MENCQACKTGQFKCNLCSLRFCGELCWQKSNHHLIGDKADLDNQLEIKRRPPNLNIKQIYGPQRLIDFKYDGAQYLLFGEYHFSVDEKIFKELKDERILSVFNKQNKLYFTGSNPEKIDITRLMYAIAANSYYKEIKTDIFFELNFEQAFGQFEQLNTQYRSEGLDKGMTLKKFYKIFSTLKCNMPNECELNPHVRIHYVDDRRRYASDDLLRIFFNFFISDASYEVKMKVGLLMENYFKLLPNNWYFETIKMNVNSDNFTDDYLGFINKDGILEKVYEEFKKLLPYDEDDDELPEGPLTDLDFAFGDILYSWNKTKKTKIRKQYLALVSEGKGEIAEKIIDSLKLSLRYSVLRELGLANAIDFMETDSTLLSHFSQFTRNINPENQQSYFKKLQSVFIEHETLRMDVYALMRMFRDYGEEPSKLKIMYSGDAHTERYLAFFNWLKNGKKIHANIVGAFKVQNDHVDLTPEQQELIKKLI
jgi:hypothetical protein